MPDTAPLPSQILPTQTAPTEIEPAEPQVTVELSPIFLGGLLLLAVLAVCYVAAEIILPIVLAFVLNAVFQPVLRTLERFYLPRFVAALVIVLALIGLVLLLGLLLAGPISTWIAQLPETIPRLQARLHFLTGPIKTFQDALEHVKKLAPEAAPLAVAVQSTGLAERLLAGVHAIADGVFTTVLVLFFVLISGDLFRRRLVEILPSFKEKRQAVDIFQQVEQDISAYLATIGMMNALVGVLTGIAMWLCGLGSPLLWGTIAFLINFVPILGPSAGVVLFLVAGLVTIEPLWMAFVPAALYLLIHLAEGEAITPMLLAARFTVNPVLVIVAVVFWYWMWGVPGAILAMPMLAIGKIICDRIDALKPLGHFIGGDQPAPSP